MDCALFLNPAQLARTTAIRDVQKTVLGQHCILGCPKGKRPCGQLLVKLRIRLHGVDAADKDIPRKDAATQFARNWSARTGNRVWLQLMGYDCRSRVLGHLFPRMAGRPLAPDAISLTKALLTYRHPRLGAVAQAYYGGNKSQAWGGISEP